MRQLSEKDVKDYYEIAGYLTGTIASFFIGVGEAKAGKVGKLGKTKGLRIENPLKSVGMNIKEIESIKGYKIVTKTNGTKYLRREAGMADKLEKLSVDKNGLIVRTEKKIKTPAQIAHSKGYKGIRSTKNGCANFAYSKYIYRHNNKKAIIKIKMTGSRIGDYKQAYDNLDIPKNLRKILNEDYTWHHLDDFNPKTDRL